jgi:hypothetical protein
LKLIARVPRVGDQMKLYSKAFDEYGLPFTAYVVTWRSEGVLATLYVDGLTGTLDRGDVLRLARRQEARIERAAA